MKVFRNILIILLMINIIILVYLIIIPKVQVYDYQSYAIEQEDIKRQNGELDEEDIIKPVKDNIIKFENENILLSNYKGEIATGYVNIKFTDLLNGGFEKLYNDTKGMNSTSLANYFEENKNDIAMETGIVYLNNFVSFINKIQIYQDKNITCEKAEILENSYVTEEEFDCFKVELTYNNGQVILFYVYISNYDFIDTPIIVIM